ncbi:MAG TPA: hypothetical protein VFE05_01990 [Longimicrobiaceae bacterium]|nr:hypothetical protein [Longimicrobiaceae bacterium]
MRHALRVTAAVLAASALRAAPAAAQFRLDLEPGAAVRVTTLAAPGVQVTGKALRTDGNGSTIVIWPRSAPAGTETRYALSDLAMLEVRGGKNRTRGALMGAGIAAALAAVFGGIDSARGRISSGELTSTVGWDAVFGAGVGALFAPRRWQPLPLPGRPAPSVEPAP